jgi:hypothetical protein
MEIEVGTLWKPRGISPGGRERHWRRVERVNLLNPDLLVACTVDRHGNLIGHKNGMRFHRDVFVAEYEPAALNTEG